MSSTVIAVPIEGRPTAPTSSEDLLGIDGNAFSVLGHTARLLRQAGASEAFKDAYMAEAMSGDYDHVLATSVAFLDATEDQT